MVLELEELIDEEEGLVVVIESLLVDINVELDDRLRERVEDPETGFIGDNDEKEVEWLLFEVGLDKDDGRLVDEVLTVQDV